MKKLALSFLAAVSMTGAALADPAVPADGLPYILESVDLSGITTTVATMGALIVGIGLTFKGISLAKRLIRGA